MFKLHHLVLGNGYISPPFRLTQAAQKFSSSANGNIGCMGTNHARHWATMCGLTCAFLNHSWSSKAPSVAKKRKSEHEKFKPRGGLGLFGLGHLYCCLLYSALCSADPVPQFSPVPESSKRDGCSHESRRQGSEEGCRATEAPGTTI